MFLNHRERDLVELPAQRHLANSIHASLAVDTMTASSNGWCQTGRATLFVGGFLALLARGLESGLHGGVFERELADGKPLRLVVR